MLRVRSITKLKEGGFSPVELLLAVTVFGMLLSALVGAIIYGRESTAKSGDRGRAIILAEEGLEATRNIADASFSNLVEGGSVVGNNNVEPGTDVNGNATSAYKVPTGTSSGSVSSVSVYITSVDSISPHIQVAIYADAGTAPGARLGVSTAQIATVGWNTFSMSGVTVTASTNYWIALSSEGNNHFADSGSGGGTAYDLSSGYPAPSTFSTTITASDKPSFYMTVGGSTQGLAQSGSPLQWNFSGTSSDTIGIYTRQISITTAGNNRKKITCTVSWPQGAGTSQVSVDTYITNWLAAIPPTITPGPIMMAYSKTTTTPFYRVWNGTSWGAEGSAQAVVGNINYVVLKSSRTRNEAIMGVQTSTGAIYVQVWNGTSWGNLTQVGTGPTTTRAFDIDYERNGDRAVIAYSPSSGSADFAYRIWNGTTLSAATTVTAPPTTGAINWIEMDNNPLSTSNDIALIMSDATTAVYGMVWNGSSWGTMGTATTWDTATASAAKKSIDVAYEQTSGRAMFFWGDSTATNHQYRIWNGTTLTANTPTSISTEAGVPEWIQLAARPNSNEIMLGVQDTNGTTAGLNTRKWSGSAWDTAVRHDTTLENVASRNFDIVWETATANAGKAWLMWGDGATVTTKQWSGSAWGTATVQSGSDDTSFVRLRADSASGAIFAGIYQNSTSTTKDINERHLTGGSSTWPAKTSIWGGPTGADPVFFRIDIATP